jgi:hypothetical protein
MLHEVLHNSVMAETSLRVSIVFGIDNANLCERMEGISIWMMQGRQREKLLELGIHTMPSS